MILAIDRSTDVTSVAIEGREASLSAKGGAWVAELLDFLASCGTSIQAVDRFIIGCGPGSFAGTRAALAFAQGVAEAKKGVSIFGLPSGAGCARPGEKIAVIGDARRGLLWVNLWDGFKEIEKCHLVEAAAFSAPAGFTLTTPDFARIGEKTGAADVKPSAARLLEAAKAAPEMLVANPLPVYLSPAVR